MARFKVNISIIIVLGLLLIQAVPPEAIAANCHPDDFHRVFQYFEFQGLPDGHPGYKDPNWQGYNYYALYCIEGETKETLYAYPIKIELDEKLQLFTCVGWKDGENIPAQGKINRITIDFPEVDPNDPNSPPAQEYSITWIYKKAHKVTFNVDPLNQSLWAWGDNTYGQLGDSTQNNRKRPTLIGRKVLFVSVAASRYHTLAIDDQGKLWAWGRNNLGQLGLGYTGQNENTPMEVRHVNPNTTWISVATGGFHTVAIDDQGKLWAWGANGFDQLGLGPEYPNQTALTPTKVEHDTKWVSVAADGYHTLAIDNEGKLWAWGRNNVGQLGLGEDANQTVPTPTKVEHDTKWVSVAAGWEHTLTIDKEGKLWAWGANGFDQLGLGDPNQTVFTPKEVEHDTKWVSVAAGAYYTVGIDEQGKLWAWGRNNVGQLGLGDPNQTVPTPTEVNHVTTWDSVVAGSGHTIAIDNEGKLWAWGWNLRDQLGLGPLYTYQNQYSPMKVVHVDPNTNWVSVAAAGGEHTVAIDNEGKLWAWGLNDYDQLGLGPEYAEQYQVATHTKVKPTRKWVSITASYMQTAAIDNEGKLWAWGRNNYGQLGLGYAGQDENTPQEVEHETNWVSVAAGGQHTLGIDNEGKLWAWGRNNYGQLGLGYAGQDENTPQEVEHETNWVSVVGGWAHTLAIDKEGKLWAWGQNNVGQLGLGDPNQTVPTPTKVEHDTKWVSVAAGAEHTVAIDNDGKLWAWGANGFGQLGLGYAGQGENTPQDVDPNMKWRSVAAGAYYTVGIDEQGKLWAWGRNNVGQLGLGDPSQTVPNPTEVNHVTTWDSVVAGGGHTVAIDDDGKLWTWGWNLRGQLGLGYARQDENTPQDVDPNMNWVSVVAGGEHTVAIDKEGKLWTWGYNGYGQLGDSTQYERHTPLPIVRKVPWVSVVAGGGHTIAIDDEGKLWTWGHNDYGQLGDGTDIKKNSPTQIWIGEDDKWIAVAAGFVHSIAIKEDGTLWAWGRNNSGQLGDGSKDKRYSPTQSGEDDKWIAVAAGGYHTVAIKEDGTLWAWGRNNLGQLGLGYADLNNVLTPTKVEHDTKWVSVAAGRYQTLAIDDQGTLWAWGDPRAIGVGADAQDAPITKPTPVVVGIPGTWVSVAAGHIHTVAIRSDGTLWAWGWNEQGQLGDDTTENKNSPIQIGEDDKWIAAAAGYQHTIAIKKDGTLWAWGWNEQGQLGDGTTGNIKTIPTLISSDRTWVSVSAGENYTVAIQGEVRFDLKPHFGTRYLPESDEHIIASASAVTFNQIEEDEINHSLTSWKDGTGDFDKEGKGYGIEFPLTQDSSLTWIYQEGNINLKVDIRGLPYHLVHEVDPDPLPGTWKFDDDATIRLRVKEEIKEDNNLWRCLGWEAQGIDNLESGIGCTVTIHLLTDASFTWKYGLANAVELAFTGLPIHLQGPERFPVDVNRTLKAPNYLPYEEAPVRYVLENYDCGKGWISVNQDPNKNETSIELPEAEQTELGYVPVLVNLDYKEELRLKIDLVVPKDTNVPVNTLKVGQYLVDPNSDMTIFKNPNTWTYSYYTHRQMILDSMIDVSVLNKLDENVEYVDYVALSGCTGCFLPESSENCSNDPNDPNCRITISFPLAKPTHLVWNYLETSSWIIGRGISLSKDVGDPPVVKVGNQDVTELAFFWDSEGKKLYPIRPVSSALLIWKDQSGNEIKHVGYASWPDPNSSDPNSLSIVTSIVAAPADLQPANSDYNFEELMYSECSFEEFPSVEIPDTGKIIPPFTPPLSLDEPQMRPPGSESVFKPTTTGKSLLRFSKKEDGSLHFVVVETVGVEDRIANPEYWSIGSEIESSSHSDPDGRNGYVYYENAYYDGYGSDRAYDRESRIGPIIPVNETANTTPDKNKMVVVWYKIEGAGIGWPVNPVRYNCRWPDQPDGTIIIASKKGSGPLKDYEYMGQIYYQPDKDKSGYNPNEEHALIMGSTVYALRNDLNKYDPDQYVVPEMTSKPYVLLKYKDPENNQQWAMKVFKVEATGTDDRGLEHDFDYRITAGSPIMPLTPMDLLPQPETSGIKEENGTKIGEEWYFGDHKGGHWAKASCGRIYYTVGNSPECILTEDLDLDEDLDLVVANAGSNTVSVLLGNGDGTFTKTDPVSVGDTPQFIAVILFNTDDQYPDLAVANAGSNTVSVLLGNGDGTFERTDYPAGAGDLNDDQNLDLVLSYADNNTVSVLLSDDEGKYTRTEPVFVGESPQFVAVGNFNEDQYLDLAVANAGSNTVSVLLGNGDGTFTKTDPDHNVYGTPVSIAVGDCDNDSDLDLVVAYSDSNDRLVLLNDGNAIFTETVSPCDLPHQRLVLPLINSVSADFNGDFNPDLAEVDPTTNVLFVSLGGALNMCDTESNIVMHWYYPLQKGFYYPDQFKKEGDAVPFMTYDPNVDEQDQGTKPLDVTYLVGWPSDAPELQIGATLTEAKEGLPDIVNWAAGEVIFDENVYNNGGPLAKLFDPFTERSVDLEELPANIRTEKIGGILSFPDLQYSLRSRLFYDPVNKKLSFRGIYLDQGMGEWLTLLNVMTEQEMYSLGEYEASWGPQIGALYNKTINPNNIKTDSKYANPFDRNRDYDWEKWGIRLGAQCTLDEEGKEILKSQKLVGVPMALTAGMAAGEGYVVLAENNDDSLGTAPVQLHVIRVAGGPYQGEIKVIKSDNVFDEKLTLRHSGDFGGEPENLYFVWYYKPDQTGLPPKLPEGSTETTQGWTKHEEEGPGKVEITIQGAGKLTLSDNWFMVHYYYGIQPPPQGNPNEPAYPALAEDPDYDCTGDDKFFCDKNNWSAWAGSPGGETAQLAEGWIKRVVSDLNPLDARVKDFRNYAPSTDVSMIGQLGTRYEGDIALNATPENLNNLGLIEAYKTVLEYGKQFSIDAEDDYGPANSALLNVSNRIADFYTLLGNEAYSDALDPTIGFDTKNGEVGAMASSLFAFQNQVDSLLEEELTLLRGRDNTMSTTRARPVYNRLIWNLTDGYGELAYVQTYNIFDWDVSGVIDELDAKVMYPQGHGDAWGHYLTGMKCWYELLLHEHFTWEPRPESVLVGGAPVPVDYSDERKFAQTAAAKARVGAEIVDLTYRKLYVEDTAGQWQGYKDTDTERAWGVDGWARRAAQGAYFDWVAANAMLPAQDPNPAHEGIQKIDRSTVPEMQVIASYFRGVQVLMDQADQGLNPLGLARGAVPFDINPDYLTAGIWAKTHFEQIYDRAIGALENAKTVFDYATEYTLRLRSNEDELATFKRSVEEQERSYWNRLIEIFGYPYGGDKGPEGTYAADYDGPDLLHYWYMDIPDLTGEPLYKDEIGTETVVYTARFNLDESASIDFNKKMVHQKIDGKGKLVDITYHIDPESPWTEPPAGWGKRRAPGEIQMALADLIKAHASYKRALTELEGILGVIDAKVQILEARHGVLASKIQVIDEFRDKANTLENTIVCLRGAQLVLNRAGEWVDTIFEAIVKAYPKVMGLCVDSTSFTRAATYMTGKIIAEVLRTCADQFEPVQMIIGFDKEQEQRNTDLKLFIHDARFEVQQMVKELETMESDARAKLQELYMLREVIQQNMGRYMAVLAKGERLLGDRELFRKRTAAIIQDYRYQDMGFRVFRNDAVEKYRAAFDLAARYVCLAARAYDYETNLIGSDPDSGQAFFADIVKQRSPGVIMDGSPVAGKRGLADPLARLGMNFEVYRGQLGFNNPQIETNRFSLRHELFRIGSMSTDEWRGILNEHRKSNLWDDENFNRYCRPFAPESMGEQPGIVIPFSTEVVFGNNYFGWPLGGGDSAYDPSNFTTKVRSVGVWFEDYDTANLSSTPRVYLVPVGADVLRSPSGDGFFIRHWHVVDQKLPVPFPITESEVAEDDWIPVHDTLSDEFAGIRKFSSFRAYPETNPYSLTEAEVIAAEATWDSRLIGRSVWNTQWLLIIPGGTLHNDPTQGLDIFEGITDIKLFFHTYAYSGN